jgi:hypothetical protein
MSRRAPRIAAVCLLAIARLTAAGAADAAGPAAVGLSGPPPRLVVVISIDQFRGDYLTRFADLWRPAVGVTGEPGHEMPGADAWFGKEWTLSVPAAALARVWTPGSRWATNPSALGTGFPHRVDGGGARPGKDFYNAFATTPFGNDFTLDMARELVRREGLGQGEVPDLLAINLSSNDYVGHAYGPDSPEVLDTAVRTDRQLADFFAFLDQAVPGGLGGVLLAVTADHGVAPVPGAAREAKLPAGASTSRRWPPPRSGRFRRPTGPASGSPRWSNPTSTSTSPPSTRTRSRTPPPRTSPPPRSAGCRASTPPTAAPASSRAASPAPTSPTASSAASIRR